MRMTTVAAAAAEDLLCRQVMIALEMTDELVVEAARIGQTDRAGGRQMCRGERRLLMNQRLLMDQGGRRLVW